MRGLISLMSQDTQDIISTLAWECSWKGFLLCFNVNLFTHHLVVMLKIHSYLTKSREIILDVVFLFIKTESKTIFECSKHLTYDDVQRDHENIGWDGLEESDCRLTDVPDKVIIVVCQDYLNISYYNCNCPLVGLTSHRGHLVSNIFHLSSWFRLSMIST